MTPHRIGPYRVLDELGRGRQGVVYRAEHADSGEVVALKTLAVADPRLRWSIRREI